MALRKISQWTPLKVSNATAGQLLGLVLALFTLASFFILIWKLLRTRK